MQKTTLVLQEQTRLTADVLQMRLTAEDSPEMLPGQFVNLSVPGLFLRRPISVCNWENGVLTLVYRVVGAGTRCMSEMHPGDRISALTGLGHGYHTGCSGAQPVLIGGGVGIPPLYYLARTLLAEGKQPQVVLGFRNRSDMFLMEAFERLGCSVTVTTEDGSAGIHGRVTDALPAQATYLYACGPEPMLEALYHACTLPGEFSLEERMGCGFGACMGCSIQTAIGPQRVCREGPVFSREVLLWD